MKLTGSIFALVAILSIFSCSKKAAHNASDNPFEISDNTETLIDKDSLSLSIELIENDEDSVVWVSPEQATAMVERKPKVMVFDMYTDWCGWCKVMDKKTYADKNIRTYLNQNFYSIKFDAESNKTHDFGQATYESNGRYHALARKLLGQSSGFPSTVFVDTDYKVISVVPGYQDANRFMKILKFFKEEKYKTMSFDEYQGK